MYRKIALTICGILLWTGGALAQSASIAVLPLEDLTYGPNGIDFSFTQKLTKALRAKTGYSIIPHSAIISFMARNRLRFPGVVGENTFRLAHNELDADLLLYGTVFHRDGKNLPPALGLILNLVDTSSGRLVWSKTSGTSCTDQQRILGVDEPHSLDELAGIVVRDLVDAFPKQFQGQGENSLDVVEIEEVSLTPRYVKAGEKVFCKVRLRTYSKEEPKVFVKAGSQIHLARQKTEDVFEASWPSTGGIAADKAPRKIRLATRTPSHLLHESVLSNTVEGRSPVTLILSWPSGKKKVIFIGSYFVDNTPPEITLSLKGVDLEGVPSFSNRILITPVMKKSEPVLRWSLVVEDESGAVVRSAKQEGGLPKRFVWDGKDNQGYFAPDAVYQVKVMAWDRSGNVAVATRPVRLAKKPPTLHVAVSMKEKQLVATLDNDTDVPLAFWRLEMRSLDRAYHEVKEGETLPVSSEFNIPENQPLNQIECVLQAKDILGNSAKRELKNMEKELAARNGDKEKLPAKDEKKESGWVQEF